MVYTLVVSVNMCVQMNSRKWCIISYSTSTQCSQKHKTGSLTQISTPFCGKGLVVMHSELHTDNTGCGLVIFYAPEERD